MPLVAGRAPAAGALSGGVVHTVGASIRGEAAPQAGLGGDAEGATP